MWLLSYGETFCTATFSTQLVITFLLSVCVQLCTIFQDSKFLQTATNSRAYRYITSLKNEILVKVWLWARTTYHTGYKIIQVMVTLPLWTPWRHTEQPQYYVGEWSTSQRSHFTPGKNAGTYWIGEWVSTTTRLDNYRQKKFSSPTEMQTPEHWD